MADAWKQGSASASPLCRMSHALEAAGGVCALVNDPALPSPMLLRRCRMGTATVDAAHTTNALSPSLLGSYNATAVQLDVVVSGERAEQTAQISPAAPCADPCSRSSTSNACHSPAAACGTVVPSILSSRSTPTCSVGGSPSHCAFGGRSSCGGSSCSGSSCGGGGGSSCGGGGGSSCGGGGGSSCGGGPSATASPTSVAPCPVATYTRGLSGGGGVNHGNNMKTCAPCLHAALLPGLFLMASDSADAAVSVETPCTEGPRPIEQLEPSVLATPAGGTSRHADTRSRHLQTVGRATRRVHLDSDCYSVSAPAASASVTAAAFRAAPLLPCSRVRYALAALEEVAGLRVSRLPPAPRALAAGGAGPASAFASAAAADLVAAAVTVAPSGCDLGLPAVPLQPAASAPAADGQRCTTGGLAGGVEGAATLQVAPPPLRVLSARPGLIIATAARSSSKQLEVDTGTGVRRSDGSLSGPAGTGDSPTHVMSGRSSDSSCGGGDSTVPKGAHCNREACSAAAELEDSPLTEYGNPVAGPTATSTVDALAAGGGVSAPSTPVVSVVNPDACLATCYQNPLAAYDNMEPGDCSYRNPLCSVNGGGASGADDDDDDDGGEDVFAMPVMPLNALLTTWSVSSRSGGGSGSRGGSGGGAPAGSVGGGRGIKAPCPWNEYCPSSSTGGDELVVVGHAASPVGRLARTRQGSGGSQLAVRSSKQAESTHAT